MHRPGALPARLEDPRRPRIQAHQPCHRQPQPPYPQVLRCALYMRLLLPRPVTNARSDQPLFANRFRPEIAALFMALAVLLTDPNAADKAVPLAVVAAALAAGDGLTHSGAPLAVLNKTLPAQADRWLQNSPLMPRHTFFVVTRFFLIPTIHASLPIPL